MVLEWVCVEEGVTAVTGLGSVGIPGTVLWATVLRVGVSLNDTLVPHSLSPLESSFFSFPCRVAEAAVCVASNTERENATRDSVYFFLSGSPR